MALGTSAWAASIYALPGAFGAQAAKPGSVVVLKSVSRPSTTTPTPTVSPTPTPAPAPAPSQKPIVLSEGDSISVFWAGNHTGIYARNTPGVTFFGKAVGGSGIKGGNSLEARFAADVALKPNYVTILIGANDLTGYPSADDWLDTLWAYVAKWKETGAKVAVATVLPTCLPQFPAATAEHATRRRIANAAIRAAVSGKIDAVIDYAADPVMGPDSAACNRMLYSDGLHPTDGTAGDANGQGKLAVVYTAAVNGMINR
ncbi:GDSL-type esterase/lipase family protein [Sphingomonas floccifaciens]|uniref:GDSL-type esterase/lipase family protein n=1 Tax=Sphingomonas floccifaciens TaxID=1844115 RepID=A0ABW4NDY8_9SPHN